MEVDVRQVASVQRLVGACGRAKPDATRWSAPAAGRCEVYAQAAAGRAALDGPSGRRRGERPPGAPWGPKPSRPCTAARVRRRARRSSGRNDPRLPRRPARRTTGCARWTGFCPPQAEDDRHDLLVAAAVRPRCGACSAPAGASSSSSTSPPPAGTRLRRIQELVRPAWGVIGDGCHPARETWADVDGAGSGAAHSERFKVAVPPPLACVSPAIAGTARTRRRGRAAAARGSPFPRHLSPPRRPACSWVCVARRGSSVSRIQASKASWRRARVASCVLARARLRSSAGSLQVS